MVQDVVLPVLYIDILAWLLAIVGVLILYSAVRFVMGFFPGS